MNGIYRRSRQVPGRWEDSTTGRTMPEGWSLREIRVGDSWDPGDGVLRTAQIVEVDQRSGVLHIGATAQFPKKAAT